MVSIKMVTRIENESLRKIYKSWGDSVGMPSDYYTDIDNISFSWSWGKQFDSWVFKQGGWIGRESGKRFIEFHDEKDAMMFLLKWQ